MFKWERKASLSRNETFIAILGGLAQASTKAHAGKSITAENEYFFLARFFLALEKKNAFAIQKLQ